MKKVELFEPAMCCPTGLCGPSIDQNLIRITAISRFVNRSDSARIIRRNLSGNPDAFVRNAQVAQRLATAGMACLPMTLVDGQIVATGQYPTTAELEQYTGLTLTNVPVEVTK